ncbi:hypothetical protein T4D_1991 [Trichinella pseudospiralis]|uniref:Uncharacterized protein n=1 Tax=Trichinella pseudospiralis TaxID=6337 RepID=A0A0V1FCP0_TRIPS|nr:hypothetical protein T4D_3851 [Trichinella pseudospiralis]KRY88961.1 hypothetical protein T4D_1991 [Trichinella pseudospiralis]
MNYYNIGELTHANIAYVAFQRIQSCSRKLAVLQISVHLVPGHSSPHLFSWHFLQISNAKWLHSFIGNRNET